jgi:hypothetical protein
MKDPTINDFSALIGTDKGAGAANRITVILKNYYHTSD